MKIIKLIIYTCLSFYLFLSILASSSTSIKNALPENLKDSLILFSWDSLDELHPKKDFVYCEYKGVYINIINLRLVITQKCK